MLRLLFDGRNAVLRWSLAILLASSWLCSLCLGSDPKGGAMLPADYEEHPRSLSDALEAADAAISFQGCAKSDWKGKHILPTSEQEAEEANQYAHAVCLVGNARSFLYPEVRQRLRQLVASAGGATTTTFTVMDANTPAEQQVLHEAMLEVGECM